LIVQQHDTRIQGQQSTQYNRATPGADWPEGGEDCGELGLGGVLHTCRGRLETGVSSSHDCTGKATRAEFEMNAT
jgi:hypothetical protein